MSFTEGALVFPDLSKEAARAQLQPYHDRFVAAIKEAVRKYNAIDPMVLYIFAKWTRAKYNGIWAYIMEEMEATFPETESAVLRLKKNYGSLEIHVGTNMIARVKRMKPNGFTSNYPTVRVTEFHTASQGELFPRLWARPLRVDIGYVEDETGTQVAKIMVARRSSPKHIEWKYDVTAAAVVTPMPAPAETEKPAAEEAHVIGRSPEKEREGTDDA